MTTSLCSEADGFAGCVEDLLLRKQYVQRSPEWYQVRESMLTASDVAAALDIKPFPSFKGSAREELLRKKTTASGAFSNRFTVHGTIHEDEARQKYEQMTGAKVLEFGLLVHPQHTWLGASPDGITTHGSVVEIKCPISREIVPGSVPHHYYPQLQIVMEVCDLDQAIFIQYKPASITWPHPPEFDVTLVPRDKAWFADALPKLQAFYQEMVAAKAAIISDQVVSQPVTQPPKTKRTQRPARLTTPRVCSVRDDMFANVETPLDVDVDQGDNSIETGTVEQNVALDQFAFVDDDDDAKIIRIE